MLAKIKNKTRSFVGNFGLAVQSTFRKRDKRIILFGAWFGEKFADNSRFLFQYLSENKNELGLTHVIWVTRSEKVYETLKQMGYEVYMMDSDESIYFHKKAGMHIICNASSENQKLKADILTKYSYGATRVNLWHGVGVVKGVGCASLEYKKRKEANKFLYMIKEQLEKNRLYRLLMNAEGGWGEFYFLSPTDTCTKQFEKFSYIPRRNFIESLYPRVCECLKLSEKELEVLDIIKKYENVVLYLPTFRMDNDSMTLMKINEELQDVICNKDILWIQKSHSASTEMSESKLDGNILSLSPEFDINVIMPYIKLLITDYSSAASDARFFHKPIVFYVPDLEEYINGANGVTEEAEELLSGPKCYNVQELKLSLQKYISDPEAAKPECYNDIREKYWGKNKTYEQIWKDILKATKYQ